MIKQFDVTSRRILTSSAIRPCEYVTFPSLVTSLINLGNIICSYKSKIFVSNKKNARNTIRLVEDVMFFLEELRNEKSRIGNLTILSLSELHFDFQKVEFLLEDCSKGDAKVWLLMKAEEVSTMFQEAVRAIGVALDVFPMKKLNLSVEVEEIVEFVKNQALKVNFLVEADDARGVRIVHSILEQFEGGFAPQPSKLQWVLRYLGICNWSGCNREVKFLETEISLQLLTDRKKEVGFLSSLMGFMTYCRCTLFDVVDSVETTQYVDESRRGNIRFLNPDDFRCPISLELMTDPVTLPTGHTYDRSSILKWFGAGNHTCPKTGEQLVSTDLVPNLALKQLIKQYFWQNGFLFPESGENRRETSRTSSLDSVAAQQAMKLLASYLTGRLLVERGEVQNKIVYEMRLISKTSVLNRSCLVESGAIPPLLILLSSMDPSTQENAIATILNLSKFPESKKELVESGGLVLILDVLQEGLKMEARQHAAGTFFYLASVEEFRVMIGEIPGIFPALMELIRDGTDHGKKNALVTVLGLLTYPGNHERALVAKLVPFLINCLKSFKREDVLTDSLAVLANLADKYQGAITIIREGAIPTIVEVFTAANTRAAKENCLSLLLNLCANDGVEAVNILVKNTSLMKPLYSTLTEGSSRATKKASILIRMLHEFQEKSSAGLMDQFIHLCENS
ncbi:hypothetical protein Leryth_019970 [Lithospermum erythrorhizon]|nr:hypothetical protein Leryth_019970 [Lithospermum erythrorhizon]